MRRASLSAPLFATALALSPTVASSAPASPAAPPTASPATAPVASSEVDLTAPDGVKLRATYWSPGKPGPAVLLLHMCDSDRRTWRGLGRELAARGVHALALDYRGFGESGGERRRDDPRAQQQIVAGQWPGDLDAAFSFLLAEDGVDDERIGAAGGSCGVNQAILLAARHSEVKTLVLLSGSTGTPGEAFLERSPWIPLMAVAADDDPGAVEEMKWLLGFSIHPANRMVEYSRGGHGTEMFTAHPELEPAIADWFAEHLIRNPVVATIASTAPRQRGPSAELWGSLRRKGGATDLRARAAAAKAKGQPMPLPPEGRVNLLGYEYLQNGLASEAVEVFLLNLEAHPKSANAFDSLADAYVATGQGELAAAAAQQAIDALTTDPNQDPEFQKAVRASAEGKLRKVKPPATP